MTKAVSQLKFPSKPGPWINTTPEKIADFYKAHESISNMPEEFDGVLHYKISPPVGTELVIVCRVNPNMEKRETRVPCNQCHNPAKFESGGFIVLANGWLVIMGPICGKRDHGLNYRNAEAIFTQAERERLAERRLVEVLPDFRRWASAARTLLPMAVATDEARNQARKNARSVCKAMMNDKVRSNLGLMVEVPLASNLVKPNGPRFERKALTNPDGLHCLGPVTALAKTRMKKAIRLLDVLGSATIKDEDLQQRLDVLREMGKLHEAERGVREAIESVKAVYRTVSDTRALFAPANWLELKRWLDDNRCPVRGEAEQHGTRRLLGDVSSYGRTADWFDVARVYYGHLPEIPGEEWRDVA